MSDLSAPEAIVKAARDAFGHVDILVNNAAVQITRGLKDVSVNDYNAVYEPNIRGVILLTQAVLPHLRAPGRIINISSVGARQGFAELSLYCSSKAALEGLTRAWAGELGSVSYFLYTAHERAELTVGAGWHYGQRGGARAGGERDAQEHSAKDRSEPEGQHARAAAGGIARRGQQSGVLVGKWRFELG